MHSNNKTFIKELEIRQAWIQDYILNDRFVSRFRPPEVQWAVTAYVRYGGKRLRPAILLFSCGAVGGDESIAIPAASAVEIFHTWTLVHDDIIDRDSTRRGSETVHEHYYKKTSSGKGEFVLNERDARHYGISVAILTGDIQHGWGISMMTELTSLNGIPAEVTLDLINDLDTRVLNTLVEGEVLDIQFSFRSIEDLTPYQIEEMLWKKTGALYEFCGRAGATIGLGRSNDPLIEAVSKFSALCGTAFQFQDDILGVIGHEKSLGKPVGSDLREGKGTLVVYYAYHNANSEQKEKLQRILGNSNSTDEDIDEVVKLLQDLGGIDHVSKRARELIEEARTHLSVLPDSKYKDLLWQWSEYMVNREF
ncbi:polyprenyl synthetase family protein [bacterium]|nr:polyprenyl synthetase family protein [bacterium]